MTAVSRTFKMLTTSLAKMHFPPIMVKNVERYHNQIWRNSIKYGEIKRFTRNFSNEFKCCPNILHTNSNTLEKYEIDNRRSVLEWSQHTGLKYFDWNVPERKREQPENRRLHVLNTWKENVHDSKFNMLILSFDAPPMAVTPELGS